MPPREGAREDARWVAPRVRDHSNVGAIDGRDRSTSVTDVIVPRAQLKVFSPLETFPPRDRERWAAYARDGRGLTRRELAVAEGDHAARFVVGRSRLAPEAALVRRLGHRVLVCPLDLDLRAAIAFDAFRRRVPEEALPAFVPDVRAREQLDVGAQPGRVPHVRDEPWAVPLHWFVAFDPSERRFTDPAEGAGPRVVHLTTVEQAVARVEHVSDVIGTAIEDGEEVLVELADLAAWLERFAPASVLELDYGRVAASFAREELAADRTCADLWEAVEALEHGDALAAAAAYATARARWRGRRAAEHAS